MRALGKLVVKGRFGGGQKQMFGDIVTKMTINTSEITTASRRISMNRSEMLSFILQKYLFPPIFGKC